MNDNWISDEARDALWFSAKLRFELIRTGPEKHEYEERVYLFQCSDPDLALRRAIEIGKEQEQEYKADTGEQIRWRFVEALKVMMTFLDTPVDRGIEVYSERIT